MLEINIETKIQLIVNRRNQLARGAYELEIERTMLQAQNRLDDLERAQTRITDLTNADLALQQMLSDLQTAQ